jgi:N-acetylmuramoyl-L-alanine amidase
MNPTKIILHHSATKDSGTVSWNAIRRYHINECKWGDIGYHFGIEYVEDAGAPAGSYEILVGRTLDQVGAHTSGHNSDSVGICFIGNFDLLPPPMRQFEAGVKLVRWLCAQYGIEKSEIYGHRQFSPKTCPGLYFDIEIFKEAL